MATYGTVTPASVPASAPSDLTFGLCGSTKLLFQITGLTRQSKLYLSLHLSVSVFLLVLFFPLLSPSPVSLRRGVIQFSEYTSGRRSVKTHLSFHNTCEFFYQMLLIGVESWNSTSLVFFCLYPVFQIFWRLLFLGFSLGHKRGKVHTRFSLEMVKHIIYGSNYCTKFSDSYQGSFILICFQYSVTNDGLVFRLWLQSC